MLLQDPSHLFSVSLLSIIKEILEKIIAWCLMCLNKCSISIKRIKGKNCYYKQAITSDHEIDYLSAQPGTCNNNSIL